MEPDGCVLHLDQVGDDALYMLHVPFSQGNPETRHCHDGSGDINPAKGYRPLECTIEQLVVLDTFISSSDISSSG